MYEFITRLSEYLAENIRRVVKMNDTDGSLEKFLGDEFRRWGFVGENVNGCICLRPAKIVARDGRTEML